MVGLKEHDPGDVTLVVAGEHSAVWKGRRREASWSSWGNLKVSVGLAGDDVHRADLRTSAARWKNKIV